MGEFFDQAKWQTAIARPDWYVKLYPELKKMRSEWESESERAASMKQEVRDFFEAALLEGTVALAATGPDLDTERRPVDTILIHHTSAEPGYRLSRMNAVQLLNVYVPYFNNPSESIPGEARLKGTPMWSSHVRNGRPVFYLYHWLMRMDGSFERLLNDNEIGWHAANWGINCRSIAICLDNDYEQIDPAPDILQKLASFMHKQYPQVKVDRILGHCEVSKHQTTCPGKHYIDGWKKQLLELFKES